MTKQKRWQPIETYGKQEIFSSRDKPERLVVNTEIVGRMIKLTNVNTGEVLATLLPQNMRVCEEVQEEDDVVWGNLEWVGASGRKWKIDLVQDDED